MVGLPIAPFMDYMIVNQEYVFIGFSDDMSSPCNFSWGMVIKGKEIAQRLQSHFNIYWSSQFSLLIKDKDEVKHTLVYCAPGEVNEITLELSNQGYRVHRFDSNVSLKDRGKILKSFADGEIQILVAIKCLDEGVDVPSTREAYFLASTSNPREFIQRRGRVLRKAEGKNLAQIYDFIVLPSEVSENMYKTIASKELPRFAEFSRYAIDRFQARGYVSKYLKSHSLEYLMDKLPWDVYNEMLELREEL